MSIITILGFCLAVVLVSSLVKVQDGHVKVFIILAAVAAVLFKIFDMAETVMSQIRLLMSKSGVDGQYAEILLKGVGICYLTEFTCDFCRDCGENSIADQAQLAGKISLIIISLPLFNSLADIVMSLMN